MHKVYLPWVRVESIFVEDLGRSTRLSHSKLLPTPSVSPNNNAVHNVNKNSRYVAKINYKVAKLRS